MITLAYLSYDQFCFKYRYVIKKKINNFVPYASEICLCLIIFYLWFYLNVKQKLEAIFSDWW